jgi:hypothetical protein
MDLMISLTDIYTVLDKKNLLSLNLVHLLKKLYG